MRRALASMKWVVVRDLQEIESATFWKDVARGARRRAAHRGHPDRGVPDARGVARGEGGLVHPDAAAGAVARPGARAARRRPQRPVVHLPPVQARARALRGHAPRRATGRSRTSRGTTATRSRRPSSCCARSTGSNVDRRARAGVRGARQRRQHGLRLLDLLGRLRRRRQPGPQPRSRQLGLGLAREPPHPLQPRVRRSRGQPVVGAQALHLVGRREVDRPRRPGLPGRQAAVLPRARRLAGHGRDRRRRPVHHDGRRPRLAVRAERPARRADADPLRAARVAGHQPALSARSTPTRRR